MIEDGKRIPDCCYGGWWTEEKSTFIGADGKILGELLNFLSRQLNAQSLFKFLYLRGRPAFSLEPPPVLCIVCVSNLYILHFNIGSDYKL